MKNKLIPIKFGLRWVIFFVLLESSTVPLVAMSNSIAIQNIAYMSIMGFIVAFICVLVLVKLLRNLLIKQVSIWAYGSYTNKIMKYEYLQNK